MAELVNISVLLCTNIYHYSVTPYDYTVKLQHHGVQD